MDLHQTLKSVLTAVLYLVVSIDHIFLDESDFLLIFQICFRDCRFFVRCQSLELSGGGGEIQYNPQTSNTSCYKKLVDAFYRKKYVELACLDAFLSS